MPGAEEMFPMLIYLLLCTNPPNIHANLRYINKFLPAKQRMNKEGYLLINITAAVSFLEKMDGSKALQGEIQLKRKIEDTSGVKDDYNIDDERDVFVEKVRSMSISTSFG